MLDRSDFLPSSSSSSSAWSHSEFTPDEDSSGLDYMLALSLQSDGESMAGGVEGNLWSGIWDHKIEKTSNTSVTTPLSPPNNNYPNFTTSAVEDHGQTGKWCDRGDNNTSNDVFLSVLIISNGFCRHHATLWVLWRAVSWGGPYFASGQRFSSFGSAVTQQVVSWC